MFYFRFTGPDDKREYFPLGGYDPSGKSGLTVKEARSKAGELSLLYQGGVKDIKGHIEETQRLAEAERAAAEARHEAERIAAKIEASRLTVKELFERWDEMRLSGRKDGNEVRRMIHKDVLPAIGHLPAHTIRKGHITGITDKIELRGANRTAKIVFTSLRTMFNFALTRDFVEVDPTAAIRKADIGGKDIERDRTLTENEIKLLARQMPSAMLIPTTIAAVWIALSTGCRIGELLKARWEHIDLEKRIWLIPAENSKNSLPLEVYLSDFALAQFKILEQHRRGEWLYPSRNKKKGDSHVSEKTVTKQIGARQSAKVKNKGTTSTGTLVLPGGKWTMHDLRRTASTMMGDLGIRPEVIDRCQNHMEQNRIRRTYQRYSYQPEMKHAWQLLGARLDALTSPHESAKVIPFKPSA